MGDRLSLYAKLIGIERPRVAPGVFLSLAAQVVRGEITGNQAGNVLGLSASEKTEAQAIIAKIGTGQGQYSRERLQDVLNIASWAGNATGLYRTEADLKSALGIS